MDSNYIINRLKSTPFKYPTMILLQSRLNNLDQHSKNMILHSLKQQIYKERNMDIQLQLEQLVYHLPIAS